MSFAPDYYALLGLEPDADPRDVKRAYREAARRLHPDLPSNRGDDGAAERFRQVREAYDVLVDPVRRREYDQFGKDPFGASDLPWTDGPPGAGITDADDIQLNTETGSGVASIFEDLFRPDPGARPAPPPPRANPEAAPGARSGNGSPWNPGEMDRQAREEIRAERGFAAKSGPASGARNAQEARWQRNAGDPKKQKWGFDPEELAEAALKGDMAAADGFDDGAFGGGDQGFGGDTSFSYDEEPPPDPRPAEQAPGADRAARSRTRDDSAMPGSELNITVQVPFLLSIRGGVHHTQFRVPGPAGRFELEDLALTVPAGLEDGGTIRLPGRGGYGTGSRGRGDLLVSVVVAEHPVFRRDGNDVLVDLPVTASEAAGGCSLEVTTIDGRARVRVPTGVRSGQRIRMRGMGLLDAQTGKRGNQDLVVQIQLPPRLGRAEIQLLQELDRLADWNPREGWFEE